jgi:hypothetical protein
MHPERISLSPQKNNGQMKRTPDKSTQVRKSLDGGARGKGGEARPSSNKKQRVSSSGRERSVAGSSKERCLPKGLANGGSVSDVNGGLVPSGVDYDEEDDDGDWHRSGSHWLGQTVAINLQNVLRAGTVSACVCMRVHAYWKRCCVLRLRGHVRSSEMRTHVLPTYSTRTHLRASLASIARALPVTRKKVSTLAHVGSPYPDPSFLLPPPPGDGVAASERVQFPG